MFRKGVAIFIDKPPGSANQQSDRPGSKTVKRCAGEQNDGIHRQSGGFAGRSRLAKSSSD